MFYYISFQNLPHLFIKYILKFCLQSLRLSSFICLNYYFIARSEFAKFCNRKGVAQRHLCQLLSTYGECITRHVSSSTEVTARNGPIPLGFKLDSAIYTFRGIYVSLNWDLPSSESMGSYLP